MKTELNETAIKQEIKNILNRAIIKVPTLDKEKETIIELTPEQVLESQASEILSLLKMIVISESLQTVDDFVFYCANNDLSFDRNLAKMTQFIEKPYNTLIRMCVEFKHSLLKKASKDGK